LTGTRINEFAYDDNNNVIKSVTITPNKEKTTHEYTYDANGNKIKEVTVTPSGNVNTCEYTYDAGGNLIRSLGKDSEGVKVDISKEYQLVYIPYDLGELSGKTKELFTKDLGIDIDESKE
jgi:YD repeat-containing protein